MPTFHISVFVGRQQTDEAKKKPTTVVKLLSGMSVLFFSSFGDFYSPGQLWALEFFRTPQLFSSNLFRANTDVRMSSI